jgi:flagellar biosynthesis protein FliQ
MDIQYILDLSERAIYLAILISTPILLAGLIVGVVISILQAVTQVQEQTLSFVPKIFAMTLVLALLLPWITGHLITYTQQLYAEAIVFGP